MLLFLGEDLFQQPPRRRVGVAEVRDHLAVAVDRDALGDQIFLDHLLERLAFDVFGVAAGGEALGGEVGRAAKLRDARRDLVGMLLLVVGVLEELRRHALGVDALRHEVMALVAQRADDLGRERLVEELEDHAAVGVVPGSHRALRDVLPGPPAQRLDVGEERPGHPASPSSACRARSGQWRRAPSSRRSSPPCPWPCRVRRAPASGTRPWLRPSGRRTSAWRPRRRPRPSFPAPCARPWSCRSRTSRRARPSRLFPCPSPRPGKCPWRWRSWRRTWPCRPWPGPRCALLPRPSPCGWKRFAPASLPTWLPARCFAPAPRLRTRTRARWRYW